MTEIIANKINALCNTVPAKLRMIPEEHLCLKQSPDKWSKKEILGHLIDSATNNHQRFVRAQFETPVIYYDQNHWVKLQNYQQENTEILINLWEIYNRHLVHVVNQIPHRVLLKTSLDKMGNSNTLKFLIEDYLNHLEHHLNQIIEL